MILALDTLAFDMLRFVWPLLRIGALCMVMPVVGAGSVPAPVRVLLAVSLSLLVAPQVAVPATAELLSLTTALLAVREIVLGIAMGLVLKFIFDAVALGGQSMAMSMGLGFAVFIDSARGINVPVLGQFLVVLATLIFIALDGHLRAIELVVTSFHVIGIGRGVDSTLFGQLLEFSAVIFSGAIRIALPAITALLIVNLAFGVMSRAAPTLNLFAVGFPVSLLFGVLAVMVSLDGFAGVMSELTDAAIAMLARMAGV